VGEAPDAARFPFEPTVGLFVHVGFEQAGALNSG
jgi:hypothetical protein